MIGRFAAMIYDMFRVLFRAMRIFLETDGEQRSASFAYYALFSLLPLLLLMVSIGSLFVSRERAADAVVDFVNNYVPVSVGAEINIYKTITGVMKARGSVSAVAVIGLLWSSTRFFQALVRGINRAWGTHEYSWWRLPLKNLAMMGIVASGLLLGILIPTIMDAVEGYYRHHWMEYDFGALALTFRLVRFLVPTIVLFYGFLMLYKFSPRRKTAFSEVWIASLVIALGLQGVQWLFVIYTRNFHNFNAVYGTFGGLIALLLWIYITGAIIIFGGCLSAARAEVAGKIQHTKTSSL